MSTPAPDHHEYDGIVEEDRPIPTWFQLLFAGTVVFALTYPLYVHDGTRLGEARFAREDAALAERRAHFETGPLSEATLRSLTHSPERVAHGRQLFQHGACVTCHGPEGTGLVGPNLRDGYWLYGNDVSQIADVIAQGRNHNTMPAQAAQMARADIEDLAIFIAAEARDHPAPGKAPDPTREHLLPITY